MINCLLKIKHYAFKNIIFTMYYKNEKLKYT